MKRKIGILSSSRADYSIYRPLIDILAGSEKYRPQVIAFGTHLSREHGYTIENIIQDGFEVAVSIDCLPESGHPEAIAANMGEVMKRFSSVWEHNHFDLIFCLGDRFEMFAAVAAGLPFNIPFAHLYGGETTTGAIDDAFRHAITHMSKWHFTSCEPYRQKVISLTGQSERVFNAGALSFDNLRKLKLMDIDEISAESRLDFRRKVVLTTFHPETVGYEINEKYATELCDAISGLTEFDFLITLPNNDTANEVLRNAFIRLSETDSRVKCTENLGTVRYLSAMKHCHMMLGNTSSGFVEASWFPTKVLNLGSRQDGRIRTANIVDCPVEKDAIIHHARALSESSAATPERIYGEGHSAEFIMNVLDRLFDY